MSRSRAPVFLGLAAAGGVGYYLYGAGGNAKVAEKQFEGTQTIAHHHHHYFYTVGLITIIPHVLTQSCKTTADVHRGAAKAKHELPGRGKQAEKELAVYGKEAGAKLDETVSYLLHVLSRFKNFVPL